MTTSDAMSSPTQPVLGNKLKKLNLGAAKSLLGKGGFGSLGIRGKLIGLFLFFGLLPAAT